MGAYRVVQVLCISSRTLSYITFLLFCSYGPEKAFTLFAPRFYSRERREIYSLTFIYLFVCQFVPKVAPAVSLCQRVMYTGVICFPSLPLLFLLFIDCRHVALADYVLENRKMKKRVLTHRTSEH